MSVSRSAAHRLAATAAASLVALAFGGSSVGATMTDHIPEDLTVALGPNVEKLPNGLYEVTLADGHVLTTHGPDPMVAMLDGHGESLGPGDPERDPSLRRRQLSARALRTARGHQPEPGCRRWSERSRPTSVG